jgi:hypothetical protein
MARGSDGLLFLGALVTGLAVPKRRRGRSSRTDELTIAVMMSPLARNSAVHDYKLVVWIICARSQTCVLHQCARSCRTEDRTPHNSRGGVSCRGAASSLSFGRRS